jgi:hypothetical protein
MPVGTSDLHGSISLRQSTSNFSVTRVTPLIYLGSLENGKSKKKSLWCPSVPNGFLDGFSLVMANRAFQCR